MNDRRYSQLNDWKPELTAGGSEGAAARVRQWLGKNVIPPDYGERIAAQARAEVKQRVSQIIDEEFQRYVKGPWRLRRYGNGRVAGAHRTRDRRQRVSEPDFQAYLNGTPGAARSWARVLAIEPNAPTTGIHSCPLDAEADDPNAGGWFFGWNRENGEVYVDLEVPVDGPVEWFMAHGGGLRYAGGDDESGVRFALAFVGRDAAIRADERARVIEEIAKALDDESERLWDRYKGRGEGTPEERYKARSNPEDQSESNYAEALAQRLRSGAFTPPASPTTPEGVEEKEG